MKGIMSRWLGYFHHRICRSLIRFLFRESVDRLHASLDADNGGKGLQAPGDAHVIGQSRNRAVDCLWLSARALDDGLVMCDSPQILVSTFIAAVPLPEPKLLYNQQHSLLPRLAYAMYSHHSISVVMQLLVLQHDNRLIV